MSSSMLSYIVLLLNGAIIVKISMNMLECQGKSPFVQDAGDLSLQTKHEPLLAFVADISYTLFCNKAAIILLQMQEEEFEC